MSAPGVHERFAQAVEARLGLRLEPDRATIVAEVLARRAAARGESIAAYLDGLANELGRAAETAQLAAELTTGETYFFRHVEQLDAFVEVALPGRASARAGEIAVLSAACSTGEEAYTLAMLVRERAPELAARVAIQAFDANPAAIGRARAGLYSPWALRATPPTSDKRWFAPGGRDRAIAAELRAAVAFAEGNLVEDGPLLAPGRWDVIFCRNALMYLTETRAREALDRLIAALAPGGYLFLGHAESARDRVDLALCATHGAFYYQREPSTAVRGAPPPAAAWFADIEAAARRVQALATTLPAAGLPAGDEGVIAALAEIRGLLATERYADARARLAALPTQTSHARDVALLRALVLTHTGEGIAAERACGELLACDPASAAGGNYLLALCRDGAGDWKGAMQHAQRALEIDPSFAMARVELGLLARRGGDRDGAIRELTGAIALLEREDEARLALFGGGFGRRALIGLCQAELESTRPELTS